MNKPSPAEQVIAAVQQDPTVLQLQTKLNEFETRLQRVQKEIASDLEVLQAKLKPGPSEAAPSLDDYASLDIDLLVRPSKTIEALREQIRDRRVEEAECAEGVRIIRNLLRRRQDERYYAEFRTYLHPAQVEVGGRVVDGLLDLAELWQEEQALREPLRSVSRFEVADIWATHAITSGHVRERIQTLQRYGYVPTAEQLRRLEAIARAEQ